MNCFRVCVRVCVCECMGVKVCFPLSFAPYPTGGSAVVMPTGNNDYSMLMS